MWRMLQTDDADDYIVATGHSRSLRTFVAEAFAAAGLDWADHVETDAALLRPSDLAYSGGDPARAAARLGWHATVTGAAVVRRMVDAETGPRPA